MLYCVTCKRVAENTNVCAFCANGYVSVLMCGICGKEVPRGQAYCATCDSGLIRQGTGGFREGSSSRTMTEITLPALPGLPAGFTVPEAVPEVYQHGQYGAKSTVFMNGRDAEILTKVGQVAALLHALAGEMNHLQGHMESTRRNMKACRNLAADLQEEIETRRGPQ